MRFEIDAEKELSSSIDEAKKLFRFDECWIRTILRRKLQANHGGMYDSRDPTQLQSAGVRSDVKRENLLNFL